MRINNWLQSFLSIPEVATLLDLALIALLALLATWGLHALLRRAEHWLQLTHPKGEHFERLKTLLNAGRSLGHILIFTIAGLMALYELNINITPLLAGAGVAGLALSLGAQTFIKDFFAGVIILIENQYRVGDVIQVGDISGSVESITLRTTRLRDAQGKLYILPNGDIRTLSNLTTGWARAVVDINIAYQAEMDQALQTLEKTVQKFYEESAYKAELLEPPQVNGWMGFSDGAVLVQVVAKTIPGAQWEVARALRKYIVEALKEQDVQFSLPNK